MWLSVKASGEEFHQTGELQLEAPTLTTKGMQNLKDWNFHLHFLSNQTQHNPIFFLYSWEENSHDFGMGEGLGF